MINITDYITIVGIKGLNNFNDSVNESIKKDWTPFGGVSISVAGTSINGKGETITNLIFSQAMARYGS